MNTIEPDPNDLTLLSERDSLNAPARPVDDSPPWPETIKVGDKFVLRSEETNPWASWVRIVARAANGLNPAWNSSGVLHEARSWLDLTVSQTEELFFTGLKAKASAEDAATFIDQFIARHSPAPVAEPQVAQPEEVLS